jgi:hypothetical protein
MVLPLPRFALRHLRPDPAGTCACTFARFYSTPSHALLSVGLGLTRPSGCLQLNLEIPEYVIDDGEGIITVG